MKDSRSSQAFNHNVSYERNPCDCNCVLFDDEPADDSSRRFIFKVDEGSNKEDSLIDRNALSVESSKKKISVSGLSKRRSDKASKRLTEKEQQSNRQSKVLVDLLQGPTTPIPSVRVHPPQKVNHTTEIIPQPVYIVRQPVETLTKQLSYTYNSYRPTLPPDKTYANNYMRRTVNHESHKKEVLNTSSTIRPIQHQHSLTDTPTVIQSQKSFAQSTDHQFSSDCSTIPRYKPVPQLKTTEVPQTVPQQLTSRSNTVELVIPPIPIKQVQQNPVKFTSHVSPSLENSFKKVFQSNRDSIHTNTQIIQGIQISSRQLSQPMPMSVRPSASNGNINATAKYITLKQVESVKNQSPEHQIKEPMKFKKIQSIGEDLDIERQDSSSEVLGHYTPESQVPIRKLVNRMSQPPQMMLHRDQEQKEKEKPPYSSNRSKYQPGRGSHVVSKVISNRGSYYAEHVETRVQKS